MSSVRLTNILGNYRRRQNYQLRTNTQYSIPHGNTQKQDKSFFFKAIHLWNSLDADIRNSKSLNILKSKLLPKPNILSVSYYYGKRWPNIHHARIRMGCSGLNADLHYNLHVSNSPKCPCGWHTEDAQHFLNSCQLFKNQRLDLINRLKILNIGLIDDRTIDTKTVLFGDLSYALGTLYKMYDALHIFICESQRFK
jgi:hypothetical protein